ncbi:hypothetical protein [Patulibacter defluvii]|uniref:hypothetical protein n=1 Tax=Patulibacter defluvii TaxID=3095358 RepID=UPI002A761A6B|nr:hypothetical protein [Patulibacter sp. DM4]
MDGLSNAHHFRRLVAAWCMITAPLAVLVAMIAESAIGTTERAYVIGKVGDPDTGSFASMALVVGLVLMVPAVLGLMHMLREREVALGHLGGAVALLGLLVLPWAFMAGLAVLALGLYRARAAQSTVLLVLVLGAALLAAAAITTTEWMAFAGMAGVFVALGAIGWMVLFESDEEWEHTPEVSGFRPLPGLR